MDEKELDKIYEALHENHQFTRPTQAMAVRKMMSDVLALGKKYERKNRKQQSVPFLKKLEELECKKVDTDKVHVTISVKDYEEIRKLFLELVN